MTTKEIKELFYKPIKIKHDARDVLVWGCTHFFHDPSWDEPLWKTRGYDSAEAHKEGLIKNWNSKASENTVGLLLGDLAFGQNADDKLFQVFQRLNFKTIFAMSGNHSAGFKNLIHLQESNALKVDESKSVIFVPNYIEFFINGTPVVASHYPLLSFNGQGGGSIHIFSHCHGKLINSEIGRLYKSCGIRAYETSVELNPFPATFEYIKDLLTKSPPVSVDGHDSKTQNPF